MKTNHHYQAYLLRCWEEPTLASHDEGINWRFFVEEVFGQKRRQGFSDLEDVLAYLYEQLSAAQEVEKGDDA